MNLIANKLRIISWLLFIVIFLATNQSKGQSDTINNNNLFSLSITCPNNPQCIFSGKDLPIDILITNNSNQNLEIPLDAMKYFVTNFYLKDIKTGKGIGYFVPPGFPIPELLKKLTLLPAHGTNIIKAGYSKKNLNKAFKEAHSDKVIFYAETSMYSYYQGSKEPIGSYENGKFEPKRFILTTERVITKK